MYTEIREIENWFEQYRIPYYTINEDLSVDVDGSVFIYQKHLKEIPVKFNIIKGDFSCSFNQLTPTEFFPKEVYGNFYCHHNKFKNLDNFPKIVTGSLSFDKNPKLKNINGLWNCDFRGNKIWCDEKWKEEIECYLISINRLKEVSIYAK
jgi:hypothetical protein